jgi:integrase/recombinase XerD
MTETIPSPTALDRPIAAWLAHQRALGRGFSIEERVLDSLRRCLARLPGADLDQGGFDCWCETLRHLDANTRRARQMIEAYSVVPGSSPDDGSAAFEVCAPS